MESENYPIYVNMHSRKVHHRKTCIGYEITDGMDSNNALVRNIEGVLFVINRRFAGREIVFPQSEIEEGKTKRFPLSKLDRMYIEEAISSDGRGAYSKRG